MFIELRRLSKAPVSNRILPPALEGGLADLSARCGTQQIPRAASKTDSWAGVLALPPLTIALWQVSQHLCAPGFSSVKRRAIIITEIPQRVVVLNVRKWEIHSGCLLSLPPPKSLPLCPVALLDSWVEPGAAMWPKLGQSDPILGTWYFLQVIQVSPDKFLNQGLGSHEAEMGA